MNGVYAHEFLISRTSTNSLVRVQSLKYDAKSRVRIQSHEYDYKVSSTSTKSRDEY